MADTDDKVVDAEIVEPSGDDDSKLLLSLDEMIKNHVELIDKSRTELTEQRDMLKDSFESDATYQEHQEEVKKVTKVRNATKAEIMKKPSVALIAEKVKSLQSQLKEYTAALSDYLREYQRVSGQSTFEGKDGEVLEIVYVAKLKRIDKVKR
ncbi:MAG TPA: hypothetical protein VLE91_02205 [Candidatus Saccharimonadales bacterium]|nr:hypothetical protein [Candidatus Saccharimonadales bacterium]